MRGPHVAKAWNGIGLMSLERTTTQEIPVKTLLLSTALAAGFVLPAAAQTTPASPFFTSSMARTIEESFFRFRALSGLSSIVITSDA